MIVFDHCAEVLCYSGFRGAVYRGAVFRGAVFRAGGVRAAILRAGVFRAVVPFVGFATAIVHCFVNFLSGFVFNSVSAVVVDSFVANVSLLGLFFVVRILHFRLFRLDSGFLLE